MWVYYVLEIFFQRTYLSKKIDPKDLQIKLDFSGNKN